MIKKNRDQSHRLHEIHESGIDWKTRTVWIVGGLSAEKAYQYIPGIRLLDETRGGIKVSIMSNGGDEGGGFALFDTLRTLKNPVTTSTFGHAFSIAALIFQAGDTRLIAPSAEIMMHNGSVSLDGGDINTDYIEDLAAEAVKNNGRYHRAIAARAGLDLEKIVKWCKDERYFSAEEAVAEGLADRQILSWKDV